MSLTADVDGLRLTMPAGWWVWRSMTNRPFTRRSSEFCGWYQGHGCHRAGPAQTLWLIELKDYRQNKRRNSSVFAEVAGEGARYLGRIGRGARQCEGAARACIGAAGVGLPENSGGAAIGPIQPSPTGCFHKWWSRGCGSPIAQSGQASGRGTGVCHWQSGTTQQRASVEYGCHLKYAPHEHQTLARSRPP